MTIALAALAGALGVAAGPLLHRVAVRATDQERPSLASRADLRMWAQPGAGATGLVTGLAAGGLAFGLVVLLGLRFTIPGYLWFVAVTVVVTITDATTKLIPNRITLRAAAWGAPLLAVGALMDGEPERIVWAAIGAFGYGAYLLILALAVPHGFGFGDVKLAPILGWFTAAEHVGYVVVAVLATHVISGVTSLLLIVTRIKGRKDHIPFGPYMVVGAYIALFAGQAIIDWYLN